MAKLDDVKVDDGVEDEDEPEAGHFLSPWWPDVRSLHSADIPECEGDDEPVHNQTSQSYQ